MGNRLVILYLAYPTPQACGAETFCRGPVRSQAWNASQMGLSGKDQTHIAETELRQCTADSSHVSNKTKQPPASANRGTRFLRHYRGTLAYLEWVRTVNTAGNALSAHRHLPISR